MLTATEMTETSYINVSPQATVSGVPAGMFHIIRQGVYTGRGMILAVIISVCYNLIREFVCHATGQLCSGSSIVEASDFIREEKKRGRSADH